MCPVRSVTYVSGRSELTDVYYAYVLRSQRTGRYHIGSTEDLGRRLQEHNGNLPNPGRSTLAGRPWELVFGAEYPSRSQAPGAEQYIKKMKSRVWIQKLVGGSYRLPAF